MQVAVKERIIYDGVRKPPYLVLADEGQNHSRVKQWRLLPEREDLRQQIQRIRFDGEQFHVKWIPSATPSMTSV